MTLEFYRYFYEILISNFMKIRLVGADSMRADRETDRHDETIVAFCSFANAPRNAAARWRIESLLTSGLLKAKVTSVYIFKIDPESFISVVKDFLLI